MNLHCLSFFQSQKIKIMSDSCHFHGSFMALSHTCRFHGPFMALSWRFLPSDFYCFSKQFHGTCLSDSSRIHRGFIADSSRIHASFFQSQKIKIMSLSWQFHGSFMALSHTSLTWVQSAKSTGKVIQKVGVGCRFVFFAYFQLHFWQYVRFM